MDDELRPQDAAEEVALFRAQVLGPVLEPFADLGADLHHAPPLETPGQLRLGPEGAPVEQLAEEIGEPTVEGAVAVDAGQARAVEASDDLGLTLESRDGVVLLAHVLVHDLEREVRRARVTTDRVDRREPAASDLAHDVKPVEHRDA